MTRARAFVRAFSLLDHMPECDPFPLEENKRIAALDSHSGTPPMMLFEAAQVTLGERPMPNAR
jgi:hypothetical protein